MVSFLDLYEDAHHQKCFQSWARLTAPGSPPSPRSPSSRRSMGPLAISQPTLRRSTLRYVCTLMQQSDNIQNEALSLIQKGKRMMLLLLLMKIKSHKNQITFSSKKRRNQFLTCISKSYFQCFGHVFTRLFVILASSPSLHSLACIVFSAALLSKWVNKFSYRGLDSWMTDDC